MSLDPEVDDYLSNDVTNASALVNELVLAYRAYGGDEERAAEYVRQVRNYQGGE